MVSDPSLSLPLTYFITLQFNLLMAMQKTCYLWTCIKLHAAKVLETFPLPHCRSSQFHFCLHVFILATPWRRILISVPGIETGSPCSVEAQSSKHWTAREFPVRIFLATILIYNVYIFFGFSPEQVITLYRFPH